VVNDRRERLRRSDDKKKVDQGRYRLDLFLIALLFVGIVAAFDVNAEVERIEADRDGCERTGDRVNVLYDYIGAAQDAWRRTRDNAEGDAARAKAVLLKTGVQPGPQLEKLVGLVVDPDTEMGAQQTVDDYAALRGRLRQAVEDDHLKEGSLVRVDCEREYPKTFPLNLFGGE
jgi:hypothetical protein